VLRKRLTCVLMGASFQRVVAHCILPGGQSLSCTAIEDGGAVLWDRF
jgi:endonuclease YncB( thermonuclease family)